MLGQTLAIDAEKLWPECFPGGELRKFNLPWAVVV